VSFATELAVNAFSLHEIGIRSYVDRLVAQSENSERTTDSPDQGAQSGLGLKIANAGFQSRLNRATQGMQ
jgi:hypothetical protein